MGVMSNPNDRPPNYRHDGQLYLRRCFVCDLKNGRENYTAAVATGICVWCGWEDNTSTAEQFPHQ